MQKSKRFGWLNAGPAEYGLHVRRGKIIRQGLGLSIFLLPGDRYCLLPATAQQIAFAADQITRENQWVQIEGFAIWKIREPARTYLHFDFSGGQNSAQVINDYLRHVVESAIRHQIANMTIEDVLRKRASIISALQDELAPITSEWGLAMDTIEIKTVTVLSKQLFNHMQAAYRDQVRMQSEMSAMDTERRIAEVQSANRRMLAETEHEQEQRAIELKAQTDLFRQAQEQAVRLRQMDGELEVAEKQTAQTIRRVELDMQNLESSRELSRRRQAEELAQRQAYEQIERIDLALERDRIQAQNSKDAKRMLLECLPEIAKNLKIGAITITPDHLSAALRQIAATLHVAKTLGEVAT